MSHNRTNTSTLMVELLMPALTLVFLGAYWWQAIDLSNKAKAFPSIVTVAAIVLVALQTFNAFKQAREPVETETEDPPAAADASWLTVSAKQRIGLLVLVGVIMFFWRDMGATIGIYIFLLSSLLILGERKPLFLIAFPLILTLLLAYLFQVVLTVIFPAGFFSVF